MKRRDIISLLQQMIRQSMKGKKSSDKDASVGNVNVEDTLAEDYNKACLNDKHGKEVKYHTKKDGEPCITFDYKEILDLMGADILEALSISKKAKKYKTAFFKVSIVNDLIILVVIDTKDTSKNYAKFIDKAVYEKVKRKRFTYSTSNGRFVCSENGKQINLERFAHNAKPGEVVHHKYMRFLATMDATNCMNKATHIELHDKYGHTGHNKGVVIKSVTDFIQLVELVEIQRNMLKDKLFNYTL